MAKHYAKIKNKINECYSLFWYWFYALWSNWKALSSIEKKMELFWSIKIDNADGWQKKVKVKQTKLYINIEVNFIRTVFSSLPSVQNKRTLFRKDFLLKVGIVLEVLNKKLNRRRQFPISKWNYKEAYWNLLYWETAK